jgi:hypothetical protein
MTLLHWDGECKVDAGIISGCLMLHSVSQSSVDAAAFECEHRFNPASRPD